jgi:hypothetical protein
VRCMHPTFRFLTSTHSTESGDRLDLLLKQAVVVRGRIDHFMGTVKLKNPGWYC